MDDRTRFLTSNLLEALKLSNRAVYAGLLFGSLASLTSAGWVATGGVELPLLGFDIQGRNVTLAVLCALFVSSGLVCSFAISRAKTAARQLTDKPILDAVLTYPAIVSSGRIMKFLVANALIISMTLTFWIGFGVSFLPAGFIAIVLSMSFGELILSTRELFFEHL